LYTWVREGGGVDKHRDLRGALRAFLFVGALVSWSGPSPTLRRMGLWVRPTATPERIWAVWVAARAATFPSRAGRDRADGDVEPSPRRVLPPSHGTESRIWLPPLSPCREGGGLLTRLPLRGRRGVRVPGRSSCGPLCAQG
jgi:hypothetical protein